MKMNENFSTQLLPGLACLFRKKKNNIKQTKLALEP